MTFSWWHVPLLLLPILPNLWSIWDIWTHAFKEYDTKVLWLLAAVFLPAVGGLLYIFIGRRARLRGAKKDPA